MKTKMGRCKDCKWWQELLMGITIVLYGAEIILFPYRLQRWMRARKRLIRKIEHWLEKKLRI